MDNESCRPEEGPEEEGADGNGAFFFPLHEVKLLMADGRLVGEEEHSSYALLFGRKPLPVRRINLAGVGALSRRLMAVERARMRGKRLFDARWWALEEQARVWSEGRAAGGGETRRYEAI